jgi:hypothetical protein
MRHYFRLNRVGCGIPRQLRPTGLDPTGATIVPCAGSRLLRVRLTERALCLSYCASDACFRLK